jgi:hypothetical protein
VTDISLWFYEARRAGPAALTLPLLAAGGITALAMAVSATHQATTQAAGLTMVRLVADVLPITVGLAAAAILGRERLLEVQLTLPTSYPVTVRRRLSVLGVVALIAAAAALAVLDAAGQWTHPAHGPLALLVPAGPAVLLAGAGAWAGARWQSAAASTMVIGVWLGQLLVWDRFVGIWQMNKVLLMAVGAGLLVAALRRLSDTEHLLAGAGRDER